MKEQYFTELSRRLRAEEIESATAGGDRLEVSLRGQPVLYVSPNSEVFLLPAGSGSEEANDLYHRVAATVDEVYEYVEAVANAPILRAADLHEEFRLLADCGGAVLAGRARRAKDTSSSPGSGTLTSWASATDTTMREIFRAPRRISPSAPA